MSAFDWSHWFKPMLAAELILVLLMLGLAVVIVRAVRGRSDGSASVWFGRHGFDGVLFPGLALVLCWVAYRIGSRLLGLDPLLPRVVLPVLFSLLVIRLVVQVLRLSSPRARWLGPVERWVSWLAWGGSVLWITGLWPAVHAELEAVQLKLGGSTLNLASLLEACFTVGLTLVIALWLSAAIETRLMREAAGESLSGRKMVANLVKAVLLFAGLMIALSAAGIDLTALGVAGGAFGVGLGLGLQRLAANYVSGFVILAERSLRIGDVVRVDGFEGRIADISTRFTVVRALNGRESIVPNEMLVTQRVENSSLADPKVALSTTVSVGYETDLQRLMPLLRETMLSIPRVLADPGPGVQLSNFGADGLELTLGFWIADPENGTGGVRGAVNLAVLDLLRREGVDIPFPQRVLHQA